MESDILLNIRRHVSQDFNEWLLWPIRKRTRVMSQSHTNSCRLHALVTLFVTAASHYVIKTEPHPCFLTMSHLNIGSAGRLIPNDESPCSQRNSTDWEPCEIFMWQVTLYYETFPSSSMDSIVFWGFLRMQTDLQTWRHRWQGTRSFLIYTTISVLQVILYYLLPNMFPWELCFSSTVT